MKKGHPARCQKTFIFGKFIMAAMGALKLFFLDQYRRNFRIVPNFLGLSFLLNESNEPGKSKDNYG